MELVGIFLVALYVLPIGFAVCTWHHPIEPLAGVFFSHIPLGGGLWLATKISAGWVAGLILAASALAYYAAWFVACDSFRRFVSRLAGMEVPPATKRRKVRPSRRWK